MLSLPLEAVPPLLASADFFCREQRIMSLFAESVV